MSNPNGPYPGRQLFLGITRENKPAFAYLVTGRSPASRQRRLRETENGIYNAPIGDQPYDWLKHYPALKYDNSIGLIAVTNGIQTEAVFEMYRLLYHCGSEPAASYLKKIMDGANYEPDSMKTPRISIVITNTSEGKTPVYIISIKTADKPAFVWSVKPKPGLFLGVSTYQGDMENPTPYRADRGPVELEFNTTTPQEIADYIYEISAATYKDDDIRVCAIGGVREADNTWKVAFINREKD
ncbi:MAG: IMP cyclohydrolase [Dehalococcoidales bacterium]|nr:IMP cyclohydrolase [Dehalococcoidales bacterium]